MNIPEGAGFRATAGEIEGFGTTPQEALNSLLKHLSSNDFTPITIWPYNRGDAYFSDAQQARLQNLKSRGEMRTETEDTELEELIDAALYATIARTKAIKPGKS